MAPIGGVRAGYISGQQDAIPDSAVLRHTYDSGDITSTTVSDAWKDNDGSISGSPQTVSGASQTYDTGDALDFDDDSNSIEVVDTTDLNLAETWSVACWFNLDQYNIGGNPAGWLWGPLSGNTLYGVQTLNGIDWYDGSQSIEFSASLDTWYHLVITSNSGSVEMYVDASSKGTASNSNTTLGGLRVGQRGDGSYPLDGSVDDVRVYNKELSSTEVSDLYNNGSIS